MSNIINMQGSIKSAKDCIAKLEKEIKEQEDFIAYFQSVITDLESAISVSGGGSAGNIGNFVNNKAHSTSSMNGHKPPEDFKWAI